MSEIKWHASWSAAQAASLKRLLKHHRSLNHHMDSDNLDEDSPVVSLIGGQKEYFNKAPGIDGGTHQVACQAWF